MSLAERGVSAVVFSRREQGVHAIFGPEEVFNKFANGSDVAVAFSKNLEDLPVDFLDEYDLLNESYDNTRVIDGIDFGLPEGSAVVVLPYNLIPQEFDVVSPNHPAQK